jgi:hypothetical protein
MCALIGLLVSFWGVAGSFFCSFSFRVSLILNVQIAWSTTTSNYSIPTAFQTSSTSLPSQFTSTSSYSLFLPKCMPFKLRHSLLAHQPWQSSAPVAKSYIELNEQSF